jgi:hypothetical protein
MHTTIFLYAHRPTPQTGKSATDLVEFYADGSPPFVRLSLRQPAHFTMVLPVNV